MKRVLRYLPLHMMLASLAWCQLTADESLDSRFSRSSLVCRGPVTSVAATIPDGTTDAQGKLVRIGYYITALADYCYRGDARSAPLTFLFADRDQAWGPPFRAGDYEIFFLNGDKPIKEMAAWPVRFWKGATATAAGITGLEQDILAVASGTDAEAARRAISMLADISAPSAATHAAVSRLANSQDTDTAIIAAFVRAQAMTHSGGANPPGPGQRFAEFARAIKGRENLPAEVINKLNDFLANSAKKEDLGVLEELAAHPNEVVREDAVYAIRNLRDARAIPFLVKQLDSENRSIRYDAVIGLSEITQKGGNYGPSMPLFEEEPDRYIRLWKDWWNAAGGQIR